MVFEFLADLIFPKECFGCRTHGSYVCQKCLQKIPKQEQLICPVCQQSAIDGKTHPFCRTAGKLNGAVALYQYRGTMQSLIKELKYRFVYDMQEELTMLTRSGLQDILSSNQTFRQFIDSKPLIVPVPLFWQRQNWRGFNQAELIARAVGRALGLKIGLNLLLRQQGSQPQANLLKQDRLVNVRNTFSVNPSFNKHVAERLKTVLLVDDVWTTGATLNECCRVLKKAGVKTVWGMTLAR